MERITVNMSPTAMLETCHASQFDVGVQKRFDLVDGSSAYTLTGAETITLKIRTPDGTLVESNVPNTSDSYVIWTSEAGELDTFGICLCSIHVTNGSDELGSGNFIMEVEADPYNGKNIRIVTVGPADICTFETTLPEPYNSVTVNVLATGGNGTPDNPNPINGYSSANIVNTQNENIVDLFSIDSDFRGTVDFNQQANIIDGTTTESSVTITKSGGKITTSGTATANINYLLNSFDAYSGHKYLIMNMDNVASFPTYYLLFKGDTGIYDVPKIVNLTSDITATFRMIINSGQKPNANFYPQIYDLTQMFGATIADYIYTLEQNSTGAGVAFFRNIYPDSYYPYDIGTTELVGKETPEATIAFGQTVYGGVLDVTRGKLTVTHANKTFIGSADENWAMLGSGSAGAYCMKIIVPDKKVNTQSKANYLESISPSATWGNYDAFISFSTNGKEIYTGIRNITSVSDWKTYLSNNPLQVVYELATPFDIDLTPVQIRALVGENNVFADCGETEVEYLAEE